MGKKWIFVILLLLFHGILLWDSAIQQSATVDEGSHLAAGLYSLRTHDFRLNRETPPLQNLVCAVFAASRYDFILDFNNDCWKKGIWNGSGTNLLKANPVHFQDLLVAGRMGSICLSVILCLVIFIWTKALWGDIPALAVLILAVLEPNLIAHGQLVTTDTSSALTFLVTGYVMWRFVKNPSWGWLIVVGISFGLTWYAKHSAVVLVPALFICFYHFLRSRWQGCTEKETRNIVFFHSWIPFLQKDFMGKKILCAASFTLVCIFIGLLVVWAGYGFEVGDRMEGFVPGQNSPLWEYSRNHILPVLYVTHLDNRICLDGSEEDDLNRLLRSCLPAYNHWSGFAKNQLHLRQGHAGFFLGQISGYGWKSYYPVLFLFKTPIVLLFLFGAGVFLIMTRKVLLDPMTLTILLIIPGIYLMVLVFFNTANIGYRHALPVLPYLLVLCAGASAKFVWEKSKQLWTLPDKDNKCVKICIALLLLLIGYIGEVVLIHPHYLSFFNGLCGGWKNGRFIAVDSNLDWGQDLLFLKKYQEQNHLRDCNLYYFGPEEYPAYYGISFLKEPPLDKLIPGDYVVSASLLQGIHPAETILRVLRRKEPDNYITPSLFFYHIE